MAQITMSLLLSFIIALIHVDMLLSVGNLGYCTLDQVKYGGTGSCATGGTKIDFTPTPKGKDWSYYVGIFGSIGTVLAPGIGSMTVSYVNLFNNIGLKYGAPTVSDDTTQLINAIDAKINAEILILKECLTQTVLKEIGTLYSNEIGGFTTRLAGVAEIDDAELHEEKLDDLYDDMCSFAETNFKTALQDHYHGLKYEILAPVFDKFINQFVETSMAYFAAKQVFCTDGDQKDPSKCINEFNYYLQRANTAMNNMKEWITNGLNEVRTQMDGISILHKECSVSSIQYDWEHYDFGVHENHDIKKMYFMQDRYGEAEPDAIDDDSDETKLVAVKMNDEGDKWCKLSNIWCETYEDSDNNCCQMCFKCYYEKPTNSCRDKLNNLACSKQSQLRSDITTYWNNLQKKYITPLDEMITKVKAIEMTKTKAPTKLPTKAPTKLPTKAPTSCSKVWEQCGGEDWQGSTCCTDGLLCNHQDQWYSQCVPPDQVWDE